MDISLTGNPKMTTAQAGATEALPAAEGAQARETPAQGTPNLTVTVAPVPAKVAPKALPAKVAEMLMKSQYETAKATIDNMKPSEREIEMRKEALRRDARKADERRAEEVAAERLRAQLTAGLLPGEKGLVKDELDRITIRA